VKNPQEYIAQLLFKIDPYWDEIPWNRQRDRDLKQLGAKTKRSNSKPAFRQRPVHVIVVPQHGPSDGRYRPGNWNIYYEAQQQLKELIGEHAVSVLDVQPDEPTEHWHARLFEMVHVTGATHILTHIEEDAGNQVSRWSWDQVFAELIGQGWDGVLLGGNFDSAFKWIRAKSRRLARMSPQFMAVDICMPLTAELVRGRVEVGPVNMPISRETVRLVQDALAGVEKVHDISFIGALYPYRVELIDTLKARGINVAVNPHRKDVATDFASSRSNQPGWLEYMRGLASSHMTINFSQSSAGPFEQLKTRVIEATLAGTYLLTDDLDRTRIYFAPDEFSCFTSVEQLPELVESLISDKAALDERAKKAQARAIDLAERDYWTQIDLGLRARGLPPVLATPADATPSWLLKSVS
jgi:hypothetical protein